VEALFPFTIYLYKLGFSTIVTIKKILKMTENPI
jgi:hypothetical protein